jgi:hypothetical protein
MITLDDKHVLEDQYVLEEKEKDKLLVSSFETSDTLEFKRMFVRNDNSSNKPKSIVPFYHGTRRIRLISEQYYMVYKAYELLEEHIHKTKTKYETIIRLRFDQLIWNDATFFTEKDILYNEQNLDRLHVLLQNQHVKLKVDTPHDNTIYVFGGGVHCNYTYVNDQFFAHNMSLLSTMKNFYKKLPIIINNSFDNFWPCHGCWIEHFFANYLFNENIVIKRSVLSGIFIREIVK